VPPATPRPSPATPRAAPHPAPAPAPHHHPAVCPPPGRPAPAPRPAPLRYVAPVDGGRREQLPAPHPRGQRVIRRRHRRSRRRVTPAIRVHRPHPQQIRAAHIGIGQVRVVVQPQHPERIHPASARVRAFVAVEHVGHGAPPAPPGNGTCGPGGPSPPGAASRASRPASATATCPAATAGPASSASGDCPVRPRFAAKGALTCGGQGRSERPSSGVFRPTLHIRRSLRGGSAYATTIMD